MKSGPPGAALDYEVIKRPSEGEDTLCEAQSKLSQKDLHIFEEDMVQWLML